MQVRDDALRLIHQQHDGRAPVGVPFAQGAEGVTSRPAQLRVRLRPATPRTPKADAPAVRVGGGATVARDHAA